MDGYDPAEDHWWYNNDYHGEATTVAAADAGDNLLDMFGNSTYVRPFIISYHPYCWELELGIVSAMFHIILMYFSCSEDIFNLVWEGGTAGKPAVSRIPSPELPRVPPKPPPSDDMMASWLYPIISGEVDHAGGSTNIPAEVKSEPGMSAMATVSLGRMTTESKGKLPTKVDMAGAKVRPYNIFLLFYFYVFGKVLRPFVSNPQPKKVKL
jgi:hypothetical protein